MFRVRVGGLPFFCKESEISDFFQGMSIARIDLRPKVGQAAVWFHSADEAVDAAEKFHGRFFKHEPPVVVDHWTRTLSQNGLAKPDAFEQFWRSPKFPVPQSARAFLAPGLFYRRVTVTGEEIAAKVVREVYGPTEPTRDELKDRVHRDAVGGQWPKLKTYGMISHKHRYRRYKPPGNPKPRHG